MAAAFFRGGPDPSPAPVEVHGLSALNTTLNNKAYTNDVGSIRAALALNAIIGGVCLLLFLVFRVFMREYQLRLAVDRVALKPPPLPTTALGRMFGWLHATIATSDVWLLHSAGLDALVLTKSLAFSVQLFLPISVLGCCVLLPLQLSEAYERGDSTFSRFTMANVAPSSRIMWSHWCLTLFGVAWTLVLLEWHYRQYVALRQHYLRSGDTFNAWRALHFKEADGVGVHQRTRFADVVERARMDSILKVMDRENASPPSRNWLLNQLTALTSWTGTGKPEDVVALAQRLARSEGQDAALKRLQSSHSRRSGKANGGASQRAGPLGEGAERSSSGRDIESGALSPDEDLVLDEPVAPRWWSTVDVVATRDGKMRRLTEEERQECKGYHVLLARPSVRYRKTVNTQDSIRRPVAVHAQQYAVLVTDFYEPLYPEYSEAARTSVGAGVCGSARVKHGDAPIWLGERYKALKRAVDDAAETKPAERARVRPPRRRRSTAGGGEVELSEVALEPAPSQALSSSSDPAVRSPRAIVPKWRTAELWRRARAAVRDGRVRALLRSESYSVVSAVFASLFPNDFDRVVPVFNFREVDLLMRRWDGAMGRLEAAENAVRLGAAPRQVRRRGAKVDLVEWLRGEAVRLENAVLEARERALVFNGAPAYFVLFRTQKAAAIASSCNLHPLRAQTFNVHPAPGPEEVNFQALWYTHSQRVVRACAVIPFLLILVLLPVSLLGAALTQLQSTFCSPQNTVLRWADYCESPSRFYGILKSLLTGFVPVLLVQLWQALAMPRLIFLAAQSEARHFSFSQLDLRIGSIYFFWAAFNFFVQGVIGSTALTQLPELVNKPFETPTRLGYALPSSAKFFLSYLILRTFTTVPLRFLIPQPGVWQAWIRIPFSLAFKGLRDSHATERAMYMRTAMRSVRYGVEFGGGICLIMLISFAFAVICPLIPLFGVGFYAGTWLFWRYNLIFNYQRKYESGGLSFPFFADRVLICAAVSVAFTGCCMMVKSAFAQATLLWVIGLSVILAYYQRTQNVFIHGMTRTPLLVAAMAPAARVPSTVYVPSPLQGGGFMWWPQWNRVWENLGMPGYSW